MNNIVFYITFLAEVMEAKRNADREELHKLKEQLLISFKDQMELRYSPWGRGSGLVGVGELHKLKEQLLISFLGNNLGVHLKGYVR